MGAGSNGSISRCYGLQIDPFGAPAYPFVVAPLAQLDRALASGAKGQRFESSRARQSKTRIRGVTVESALQVLPFEPLTV